MSSLTDSELDETLKVGNKVSVNATVEVWSTITVDDDESNR